MFYHVWDEFLFKVKFCYKTEKTRFRVVHRKLKVLPTQRWGDNSLTDVRSQCPAPSWELEESTRGRRAGSGMDLLYPRLGEGGRSSCWFPEKLRWPIWDSALPRSAKGWGSEEGQWDTASARSSMSLVGGQHMETSLEVGYHGKHLIQLFLSHFRKELHTPSFYFVRVFFLPFIC